MSWGIRDYAVSKQDLDDNRSVTSSTEGELIIQLL